MRGVFTAFVLFLIATICRADQLSALRVDLRNLKLDPLASWHVRELELARGTTKIYLTEGILSFATQVAGHRVAAVFTTEGEDGGDGEIIAFPPNAAERASLTRFTTLPNMDEHFHSALLFFADDTAQELLQQVQKRPLRPVSDLSGPNFEKLGDVLNASAVEIEVRIAQSILDHHSAGHSFLYATLGGRTVGLFDFVYQPDEVDSEILGRVAEREHERDYFQLWSAYHAKNVAEQIRRFPAEDYRIDTAIGPDLAMKCVAEFDYEAEAEDGRVIRMLLTPKMHVTSAQIDGHAAAVLVHESPQTTEISGAVNFLLVNGSDLVPGSHHKIHVEYEGTVIRRMSSGSFFVDDRNAWYPFVTPMLTNFDLSYRVPADLQLVSTGEALSDEVRDGQRIVHYRTTRPQALAGFNLGRYELTKRESGPYEIEVCANPQNVPPPDLAEQAAKILAYFSTRWMPLGLHRLFVTPIEGYFGQGFPGLIYLSNVSYLPEGERPPILRNSAFDAFFSQLLLPHEIAHQWWGNEVAASAYRSNWIIEAMANYSALQYLDDTYGKSAPEAILERYRADLSKPQKDGELIDTLGPVTFDERLLNNFGVRVWHDILYEKGTWILHMLRVRMGDANFLALQQNLLKKFSNRTLSNEELREEAAKFIPANQPDRQLVSFFDTWVYGTGIPILRTRGDELSLSGVPDSFVLDVPLTCGIDSHVRWVRVVEGEAKIPANCRLPSFSEFLFRQ